MTNLKETVTTGNALASHSASDGRAVPHGTAFGKPFFNVDSEVFSRAHLGREKKKHWSTFVGDSDTVKSIRDYARSNGNPDILLRSPEGTFMYAQKGHKKNG